MMIIFGRNYFGRLNYCWHVFFFFFKYTSLWQDEWRSWFQTRLSVFAISNIHRDDEGIFFKDSIQCLNVVKTLCFPVSEEAEPRQRGETEGGDQGKRPPLLRLRVHGRKPLPAHEGKVRARRTPSGHARINAGLSRSASAFVSLQRRVVSRVSRQKHVISDITGTVRYSWAR